MKPKRVSMGCYAVEMNGQQVLLRRQYPRGFRVILRPGAKSPVFRLLRDAAALALEAIDPWPFDVPKQPDLAHDLPNFLKRTA